jgi:hypothetical protein
MNNDIPTTAELRQQYREFLITKMGGSEILADAQLEHEIAAARAQHQREAELRIELDQVNAAIATFNAQTQLVLAPLRAEADNAMDDALAAAAHVEDARNARERELAATLGQRRDAIARELGARHRIEPRTFWRRAEGMPSTA